MPGCLWSTQASAGFCARLVSAGTDLLLPCPGPTGLPPGWVQQGQSWVTWLLPGLWLGPGHGRVWLLLGPWAGDAPSGTTAEQVKGASGPPLGPRSVCLFPGPLAARAGGRPQTSRSGAESTVEGWGWACVQICSLATPQPAGCLPGRACLQGSSPWSWAPPGLHNLLPGSPDPTRHRVCGRLPVIVSAEGQRLGPLLHHLTPPPRNGSCTQSLMPTAACARHSSSASMFVPVSHLTLPRL